MQIKNWERVSQKYNKLTDYFDIIAGSQWIVLKLTNQVLEVQAYIILQMQTLSWINIIEYWLRLGNGKGKGEERREDLNTILALLLEEN